MIDPEPAPAATPPDPESAAWVRALAGTGPAHDDAVRRLHALLLRAARFELARRAGRRRDLDDLAQHAADDALVAVLRKLPGYRGASRFTTWAYKFALLEAGVQLRRRTWEGREVALDGDGWARLADRRASPGADAEIGELLAAIREAIATALTAHQRAVLVALTLDDVPI